MPKKPKKLSADVDLQANPDTTQPQASRPRMPAGFGMPKTDKGMLAWKDAAGQLATARNYWVGTTRPDGRPHLMPVWGLWVLERLYFGTDRRSRKARNLAANSAVVVHLESADDVVIVEGEAVKVEFMDEGLLEAMDRESFEKYGSHISGQPEGDEVIYRLEPHVAFAWRTHEFPGSATRWTFARRNA
jgi:hypothetical protein